jgi:hypothetical protein
MQVSDLDIRPESQLPPVHEVNDRPVKQRPQKTEKTEPHRSGVVVSVDRECLGEDSGGDAAK